MTNMEIIEASKIAKGSYATKDDVLRSMYQRNMQECRQAIEELLDIAIRTKAGEEM